MSNVKVEIYCKAEAVVVGTVETDGGLDEKSVKNGLKRTDSIRCPFRSQVQNGIQQTCGHCLEPLWLRGVDGELFAFNPGTIKAEA